MKTARELLEPLEIPLDPDEVTEEEFHDARMQAAVLIRKHFWQGNQPPARPPRWGMGRELNVWARLARQHGPVQVNGAITVARDVLGIPTSQQVTMLIFNSKNQRHLLLQCIQKYQQQIVALGGTASIKRVLGVVEKARVKQLEEEVERLRAENARLEAESWEVRGD